MSKKPDHYTESGTRKYQCAGPIAWEKAFKEMAEMVGGKGTATGVGIRVALAASLTMPKPQIVAIAKAMEGQLKAVALVAAPKAPKRTKKAAAK